MHFPTSYQPNNQHLADTPSLAANAASAHEQEKTPSPLDILASVASSSKEPQSPISLTTHVQKTYRSGQSNLPQNVFHIQRATNTILSPLSPPPSLSVLPEPTESRPPLPQKRSQISAPTPIQKRARLDSLNLQFLIRFKSILNTYRREITAYFNDFENPKVLQLIKVWVDMDQEIFLIKHAKDAESISAEKVTTEIENFLTKFLTSPDAEKAFNAEKLPKEITSIDFQRQFTLDPDKMVCSTIYVLYKIYQQELRLKTLSEETSALEINVYSRSKNAIEEELKIYEELTNKLRLKSLSLNPVFNQTLPCTKFKHNTPKYSTRNLQQERTSSLTTGYTEDYTIKNPRGKLNVIIRRALKKFKVISEGLGGNPLMLIFKRSKDGCIAGSNGIEKLHIKSTNKPLKVHVKSKNLSGRSSIQHPRNFLIDKYRILYLDGVTLDSSFSVLLDDFLGRPGCERIRVYINNLSGIKVLKFNGRSLSKRLTLIVGESSLKNIQVLNFNQATIKVQSSIKIQIKNVGLACIFSAVPNMPFSDEISTTHYEPGCFIGNPAKDIDAFFEKNEAKTITIYNKLFQKKQKAYQ